MATRIADTNNRAQLENLVNRWEARWRLRRVVLYLPRVLMGAIAFGILLTLLLILLRVLTPGNMIAVVSGGIAASVVIISSGLGLFGKNGIEAARQFDKIFGLQERISTAIEIIDGRIKSAPELAELQIADAMSRAQDVDPRKHIKIEIRWMEWLGVVGLLLMLGLILGGYVLFSGQGANDNAAATQTAIQQAADDVRDITEDVATDSALTDAERSNLLESLEVTLDELSEEDAGAEAGFVAMSELETDLSELSEAIKEERSADEAALSAAAEAMQNPSDPNPGLSDQQAIEALQQQLEAMEAALTQLTPEQAAQLQQQLSEASTALQQEFPELSQLLQELAQDAEFSQNEMTPEELQQALENLQALQEQLQERDDLAEALEEAARQARENADNIAQSEQQDQQGQNQQPQAGEQQEEGQAQAEQGQQQQGQQPGQQEGGQSPSQGQDGEGQTGESNTLAESDNPSSAQMPVQSAGQQQQSGEPQTSQQEEGGAGAGSGEGEASSRQDGLGQQGQQPPGENQADGEGEIEYEAVYAPNAINADGEGDVILQPDASDSPVVEGDFQDNPSGEALVPYNQVFRSYENAANRALENDYVPLGMQDVVRDYFSSLQPTGNNQP